MIGLTGVIADRTRLREMEDQLRLAQKMEAVGRLAGGVAHDFNNLLSVVGMYVELALEQVPAGDPLRADLDEIRKAGVRAQALTRQLLAFSRRQVLKPESIDLNVLIAGVTRMLGRVVGEDVELTFAPTGVPCVTHADPGQLEQVLLNLVLNARDATRSGGKIRIATERFRIDAPVATVDGALPPGAWVAFTVADDGAGMDEATIGRIFEPFFTTKGLANGTGLGLSIVYGIVQQSGGAVDVQSAPGAGATFRVYLPATPEERPSAPDRLRRTAPGGTERILVVEDEPVLGKLAVRVLSSAGYDVLAATDPAAGRRLFDQHAATIALLVTDVIMPGIDGYALARTLREAAPALRVLFMSGYTDETVARRATLPPGVDLLEKPFSAEDLLLRVRRALDAR